MTLIEGTYKLGQWVSDLRKKKERMCRREFKRRFLREFKRRQFYRE
jgi:hypothetical protein